MTRYILAVTMALAVSATASSSLFALNLTGQSCQVIGGNCAELTGEQGLSGGTPVVANAINVALGLLGGVAVIMLIVGGLRYILSQGESSKVAQAKNTIMYAVIGIVLAIFSYAIVIYVTNNIV